MSFEIFPEMEGEEVVGNDSSDVGKLRCCFAKFINLKDRKIMVLAYGVFVVCLGLVLTVGHFAIRMTTTSTVNAETSIPTILTSVMVFISGVLFSLLVFKKQRYLIFSAIISSTTSGILSSIGAVHYGFTVSDHLTALSDCLYTSVRKLCTCSVVTGTSKVVYNFENTVSCNIITEYLREVAYGMCGVYAVTFVSCFGSAVYVIFLAHKIEVKKIKSKLRQHEDDKIEELSKEKRPLEDNSYDVIGKQKTKCGSPWQQDVATQTSKQTKPKDANCRHHCRHFVEVTVPDTRNDFVVNITKARDPPPPYCETVYT